MQASGSRGSGNQGNGPPPPPAAQEDIATALWSGDDSFINYFYPVQMPPSDPAFVAESRIGDANTSPHQETTFELDLYKNTSNPPASQTQEFSWQQNVSYPFSLTYTPGTATFVTNNDPTTTITYNQVTWSGPLHHDALFVRTYAVDSQSSMRVSNLQLTVTGLGGPFAVPMPDGVTSPATVQSNPSSTPNTLQIGGVDLQNGFTLTGTSTWTWSTTSRPLNSQVAFQLKAGTWMPPVPNSTMHTCSCSCSCSGSTGLLQDAQGADGGNPASMGASANPVRYFDGSSLMSDSDLMSGGFGASFGQTRGWSNQAAYDTDLNIYPEAQRNGTGEILADVPWLLRDGTQSIVAVLGNGGERFFDLVGNNYQERYYGLDTLVHDDTNHHFILTDTQGDQIIFNDFTGNQGVAFRNRGQFVELLDAAGNTTQVTRLTNFGSIWEIQRTDATGYTESWVYTYSANGPNTEMLTNVLWRRGNTPNGPWTMVREVAYTYYNGTEAHGNLGDLKFATIEDPNNNNAIIDQEYYRYYTQADLTGGQSGYLHGLKYVFSAPSDSRLTAALHGADPSTADDTTVSPYADNYFQYDMQQRVTEEVVQGAGPSSGNGLGIYTYAYANPSGNPAGANSWQYETTETLPDNSQNLVYTNSFGEVMLNVFQSGSQQWLDDYQYDSQGRMILHAHPSGVIGYNPAFADLVDKTTVGDHGNLKATSGLFDITDYGTQTMNGDVLGYFKDAKIQQGYSSGTAIELSSVTYMSHTASAGNGGGTIYPVLTSTEYQDTAGTIQEVTTNQYSASSWYNNSSGATNRLVAITVQLPTVSMNQNGPGTPATESTTYDAYGRAIQTTDPDGYVDTMQYDQGTGALTQMVVDSGGTGHLNLMTTIQVDGLGRETKRIDPNTNVTYTVYLDTNHETRTYPGWQPTNPPTTTGPIVVTREYRPSATNALPLYDETLTMSTTPAVNGMGQPTGAEAIQGIQSLSRSYTNNAGQVVRTDDYFNPTFTYATTPYIGQQNVNFYTTQYAYDNRGRQYQTITPNNTINETDYDALSRPIDQQVGTTVSNLTIVSQNQYDLGVVGDSNLTQVTQYPNGTNDPNNPPRVTNNWFDWRDRLVYSKQGVQSSENDGTHRPITYTTYDNLDEVTQTQQYDGDGVNVVINSGGVPQPPSASLLRAETDTSYDLQGRVYLAQTYSVDTSGNRSVKPLSTNNWYDLRGDLIKTVPPGGQVTKTHYDGAGRPDVTYVTDTGNDNSWSDAGNVTKDHVLSQTETTYDGDGNAIFVVQRDRFNTDPVGTMTGLGALGTPTSTMMPNARVSYVANYYDAADRLTDSVDVGTNQGASYSRPMMVPARSNTVLVTSNRYQADAMQQVALTGGPTGGYFVLSFNNQPSGHINFNASAADVQSALNAIPALTGNVQVAGPARGPWAVRFVGALGGAPQLTMTGDGSGLMGGNMPGVSVATVSQGGDAGRIQTTIDPRGLVAKTDYDLLGRTVRTIEAYANFAFSDTSDRTTEYTYDGDGHVLTLQADLGNGTFQRTGYVYGVSSGMGGTGSYLNSNDLLHQVQYPDPVTGLPSTSANNDETYGYNALGQTISMTDRNGTAHAYSFDVLGRTTLDAVTIPTGSTVSRAIQALGTAYDTYGNPYLFTSYADPGATQIVNQVEDVYNGFGQLTNEYQSHSGAVNTSTTPQVQYAYSFNPNSSMSPNNSRLVSMTYPNGRQIDYGYNTETGSTPSLDDAISRVSYIADDNMGQPGQQLEAYAYLGLSTVVDRSHPQTGIDLTYINQPGGSTDGGDQYTGLDRFDRVVDQLWAPNTNLNAPTDRFQYGYDPNSNVLYRNNLVNTSFGELYHLSGSQYGYDNFNQLTDFARGTLNSTDTGISGTPSETQDWTYDVLGNWNQVKTNGVAQNRTHNAQNEITSLNPGNTPGYDSNGNTTQDDNGNVVTYDAWNRLVSVFTGGNPTTQLGAYSYDALGRRIRETVGFLTTTDLYYSSSWQVLEEDQHGAMTAQYVWSPVYVDALVERDTADGTRLYVQQDANYNVTALVGLVGGSWQVVQRFVYDPFGKPTVLDANFNPTTDQYHWVYLHQGGRYETATGLYYFRNRDYSPTLGRWMQVDPLGYGAGNSSLYGYVSNAPTTALDPIGLTNCCGPDVTAWYFKDIVAHINYAKSYRSSWLSNDLTAFREQAAHLMSYKWMSFNVTGCATGKCKNTVSLAGLCIRKNQLGNITFLIIASMFPPGWGFHSGRDVAKYAYDNPAVSTYLKSHPHARNYGFYSGRLRNDNLAAFGIGDALSSYFSGNYAASSFSGVIKKLFSEPVREVITRHSGTFVSAFARPAPAGLTASGSY